MDVSAFDSVTLTRDTQLKKTYVPNDVTVSGTTTAVKPVHPLNALLPNDMGGLEHKLR